MEYCGPQGIPRMHFLGGPNRWTQHDRDAALWWLIYSRQACPECGTRPDEWKDDPEAYEPSVRHCRGCEVKARADDDFEKHRREYRRGSTVHLIRRAPDGQSSRPDISRIRGVPSLGAPAPGSGSDAAAGSSESDS